MRFALCLLLAAAASAAAAQPSPDQVGQEFYEWTDASGRHSVLAAFVAARRNHVALELYDSGLVVTLHIDQLDPGSRQLAVRFAANERLDDPMPSAWLEHHEEIAEGRVYALNQRRLMAANKPPARGWTAIAMPAFTHPAGPVRWNTGGVIRYRWVTRVTSSGVVTSYEPRFCAW